MSSSAGIRIGELGRRAGVSPKTIRYYEGRGLLPKPERLANGYRVYDEEDVRRLEFIRGAQAAGLSLQAVSDLLAAVDGGESPCCLTRSLARDRIMEIDQHIQMLQDLRGRLAALLNPEEAPQSTAVTSMICPLIGV